MATPDYVLDQEYNIDLGLFKNIVLPAGSFVKPIDTIWLPKHILEGTDYRFFDPRVEVFCYCRYGIQLFPKKIIRRV